MSEERIFDLSRGLLVYNHANMFDFEFFLRLVTMNAYIMLLTIQATNTERQRSHPMPEIARVVIDTNHIMSATLSDRGASSKLIG